MSAARTSRSIFGRPAAGSDPRRSRTTASLAERAASEVPQASQNFRPPGFVEPQLGQTMEEGTVVNCLVNVGDEVKKGDVVMVNGQIIEPIEKEEQIYIFKG